MAYIDQDRSREKMVSGAISIAIVGAVGVGLVSGLAMEVIPVKLPDPIIHNWRHIEPAKPKPMPTQHKTQPTSPRTTAEAQPQPLPRIDTTVDLGEKATTIDLGGIDLGGIDLGGGTGTKTVDPPPPPPVDHSTGAVPRSSPGTWVTTDDYPPGEVRAGVEGRTSFRLDIGVDGRPTACTVLSGSGSDSLDRTACRKLMSRARFKPALDTAGHPAPSTYSGGVTWKLPAK
jgi:protein TonB